MVLAFIHCVTLGKSLPHSMPQFPTCKTRIIAPTDLPHSGAVRFHSLMFRRCCERLGWEVLQKHKAPDDYCQAMWVANCCARDAVGTADTVPCCTCWTRVVTPAASSASRVSSRTGHWLLNGSLIRKGEWGNCPQWQDQLSQHCPFWDLIPFQQHRGRKRGV